MKIVINKKRKPSSSKKVKRGVMKKRRWRVGDPVTKGRHGLVEATTAWATASLEISKRHSTKNKIKEKKKKKTKERNGMRNPQ